MYDKVDWKYLITDSRGRIYLLWAVITALGFTVSHFSRKELLLNSFWIFLSFMGLGYMYKVMPLRLKPARQILLAWLVPITIGIGISVLAFRIEALAGVVPYLGVFWLLVMAVGYVGNGLADPPGHWYYVAAGLNIVAALLCYVSDYFINAQFLVTAIISAWSMLYLWIFRTEF